MTRRLLIAAALFALIGCDAIPKDPEGTLERVRETHLLRVGVISPIDAQFRGKARDYLARVAAATGAQPMLIPGHAEALLPGLDAGSIDLVIGEFGPTTPWLKHYGFVGPIGERMDGDRPVSLSPVAQAGENRWIMLLQREARRVYAGAGGR